MGEAQWSFLTDGLDAASLDRGTTSGFPRPNGGGTFVFGFNSLVVAEGACGLFTNQANFAPTPALKGGRISGAIKRGISAGETGFAPMLFILGQGSSVNDNAYILGLEDDAPHRISLRKGSIVQGIPSAIPGAQGILRRSTATFAPDLWHHLRLDAIVNENGDVLLKCFSSNLVANAVSAPSWVPIVGIENTDLVASHGAGIAFVDDAIGVNSGSQPYTSGRMGFAMYVNDVSRRGVFDHIECARQS